MAEGFWELGSRRSAERGLVKFVTAPLIGIVRGTGAVFEGSLFAPQNLGQAFAGLIR